MTEKKFQELPIRVAIRKEGEFVNAYVANLDTMKDAILIGSLSLGVARKEGFFERWKQLMMDVLERFVEERYGRKPEMHTRPGPGHERGGNA